MSCVLMTSYRSRAGRAGWESRLVKLADGSMVEYRP
jgi:hypothetical protein